MSIVLVDNKSLPIAPYVGLRPPDNMATRNSKNFVYGFPLSDEWFEYRYLHDLGPPVPDEETMAKRRRGHQSRLVCHLIRVCDWMEGRVCKCFPVSVQTATVSSCWFLMIGTPGCRPSAENVVKLRDKMRLYGIREMANWYPKN
ncbi:hypothetical protein HYPSUDRAFT_90834 [Hypholoma sublateritium FD-334 SS-4]|uniref:Uncharacterized protein n=1 Tax=Hypholoma sublateritium (strain FD-334 SS-4) TaxID=945553 RepID=A0A0D2M2A2_HYPSF|nr:hypothetical protein HYPSUDRAFT_90834 [Hypholoma sublateritium FD-334 SS-4]